MTDPVNDAAQAQARAIHKPTVRNLVGDAEHAYDDTQRVLEALDAVSGYGDVYLPPGRFQMITPLIAQSSVRIRGAGRAQSTLAFSGDDGLVLAHTEACFDHARIDGAWRTIAEWPAPTLVGEGEEAELIGAPVNVGDECRSVLKPIATAKAAQYEGGQEDAGLHFVCVAVGEVAPGKVPRRGIVEPVWSSVPGVLIQDGDAVLKVIDGSLLTISASACYVRDVSLNYGTDCALFIEGQASIAGAVHISDVMISFVHGHGIYLHGQDASQCSVRNAQIYNVDRGAAVYDAGFFGNGFKNVLVDSCRRSFVSTGNVNYSLWSICYFENTAPPVFMKPAMVQQLYPPILAPQSNGVMIDGSGSWTGPLTIRDDSSPPLVRTLGNDHVELESRDGDVYLTRTHVLEDGHGGASLVQDWAGSANEVSIERTLGRSIDGPNRVAFPQGYYLGREYGAQRRIWITALDHEPTADDAAHVRVRLWDLGFSVRNTAPALDEPESWTAAKRFGWGGGRLRVGRTRTGGGHIMIGEGLEPLIADGFVYRVECFEVKVGEDEWVLDPRASWGLPESPDPQWQATGPTYEYLDSTHRIVWSRWGDVGDAPGKWLEGFKPTVLK